jgi:hypothetical protein
MTGGARLSVRAVGRPQVGLLWAKTVAGQLGCGRFALSFFISNSYFQIYLNKQTNFEFKPRFESKHPKKQCTSMHATVNSYI